MGVAAAMAPEGGQQWRLRRREVGSSGGGDAGRWATATAEPGGGYQRRQHRKVGSSGDGGAGRWAAEAAPVPRDGQQRPAAGEP
jgi:hypothetical protein